MKRFAIALVALLAFCGASALAQSVAVLPNAMTQFSDANGAPYAGGRVYFYVPGTTTPKATWQDPYSTTLNQNPLTLDASGRAVIWGNGVYREVLQDLNGATVWDQLTYAAPANPATQGYTWYGTATGTANAITLTGPGFSVVDGQTVGFLASATNTNATSINASGTGSIAVNKNTASGLAALAGGEIAIGTLNFATYSSSANAFVLQNAGVLASSNTWSGNNTWTGNNTWNGTNTFSTGLVGTATNDNAAAGRIGEYVFSDVSNLVSCASCIALTAGTIANVTSVTLSGGDWDCYGNVGTYAGVGTITTKLTSWLYTAGASLPTYGEVSIASISTTSAASVAMYLPTPTVRYSLAGTQTVYLEVQAGFNTSTLSAFGFLGCRRAR